MVCSCWSITAASVVVGEISDFSAIHHVCADTLLHFAVACCWVFDACHSFSMLLVFWMVVRLSTCAGGGCWCSGVVVGVAVVAGVGGGVGVGVGGAGARLRTGFVILSR